MKMKKTLKEHFENAKVSVRKWWDENKEMVILAGIGIVSSGFFFAIGELDGEHRGKRKGWNAYADWLIDKSGEDMMTIWEHDENRKKVVLDAVVTERFYDAFKHPEKVRWYDDGSFDYVDDLKDGD